MGLRNKMLSGFLILAAMLLVAGGWSIYELQHIGRSAQQILDENYLSIEAAKSMTEALERQDSAVLLLLMGNREEGRAILDSADDAFYEALETARNNITLSGESDHLDTIAYIYDTYREFWSRPIVRTDRENDLNWYFNEVQPSFLKAKHAVSELMALNSRAMYTTAYELEGRAHRAVMPGVIAIISALIFSLLFSFLINRYVVTPIIKVTDAIKEYLAAGKSFNVEIETNDELSRLVSSIHNLIAQLQALRDR